jgi:hypothetical protein
MNIPETLKMPSLSGLGKKPQRRSILKFFKKKSMVGTKTEKEPKIRMRATRRIFINKKRKNNKLIKETTRYFTKAKYKWFTWF